MDCPQCPTLCIPVPNDANKIAQIIAIIYDYQPEARSESAPPGAVTTAAAQPAHPGRSSGRA